MGEQIKAHKIKAIGGVPGSDGHVGLVKFVRETPATSGETDIWMAVPNQLLPYLAVQAFKLLPQPKDGATIDFPHVMGAEEVVFGVGPLGELVLSLKIEKGASLSFRLDLSQAQALCLGMQAALGDPAVALPPSGARPN